MNDHFSWISALIRAFYSEGIRNVFISPGSRSTPLSLAVAAHPGMKKFIVLDERSAAFQALGAGKKTGIPALLICTSGTAVANYLPAVVEARMSGTPLIVLSADRPPFLRGIGSSQTIDQIKIFGDYAVFFHELGEPVHREADIMRLELLARQAVSVSINRGGTAHLNIPFRKPLEPEDEPVSIQKKRNREQANAETPTRNSQGYDSVHTLSVEISDLINKTERPLVIAGPDNPYRSLRSVVSELVNKIKAPLLAEPGANLPGLQSSVPGYDIFLRSDNVLRELQPDLIIRFGSQPFSKSLSRALKTYDDVETIQFLSYDTWQDETCTVNHRLVLTSDTLNTANVKSKKTDWFKKYGEYGSGTADIKNRLLSDEPALTDGHVFDHITRNLSDPWDVMLSNSFIVRDFNLFSDHSPAGNVITNRGASGIDGIVSTALGVGKTSDRPVLCMAGDLAFLHDSNAMLSANSSGKPFVIVVVNNGGGTIFRMLPVARQEDYFKTYFETPQTADIRQLAAAHNLDYRFIDSKKLLEGFSLDDVDSSKATVIECKTDADASMALRNKLWSSRL